MSSARTVRRVVLPIIVVFIVVIAAGSLSDGVSASKTADYSLGVSPTSQTVHLGDPATYTVTVSSINNWNSPVTLTTTGVPSGATACFTGSGSPPCITSTPAPSSVTLIVRNAPMRSTPYTITVNGQSGNGSTKHSVDLMLTVNAMESYSLSALPSSVIVIAGAPAVYSVAINRLGSFVAAATLSASGLPPYSVASFNAIASTLTVTTDESKTPSGTFPLLITGTSPGLAPQSVQVSLVVSTAKGTPFGISGDVGDLAPGKAPTAIDLTLKNLNHKSISVTALSVAIGSLDAPNRSSARPCSPDEYAVTQYSGALPLTIPGDGTINLSDPALGVPITARPTVQLKNRPWDQKGCIGAILQLTFSGAANGN
jgi:hypothetical protein